ncbi:MAG TPA: substrate-binding domain-containing protein [Flavisolibacter sp.]
MKKRLSIHDIARHLNVSAATVSFVLNGRAEENRIRKEVADAILQYVKQVGYRPNRVAQSLRTGKTQIIGMLVEGISNPFFAAIARIVEQEAYQLGYKLFYSSTDNDAEKARALLTAFRESQVDGYIIAPTPGMEADIRILLEDRQPLVLFDRAVPGLEAPTVVVDNYMGAREATTHLLANGFSNIGFVTLDSLQSQMVDRQRGYLDAIAGKQEPAVLHIPYSLQHHVNVDIIRLFIQNTPKLDAIFFATNYFTLAGLEAMRSPGMPASAGTLGVVSFDDNSHFNLFSPSITAVAQPVEELSHAVVELLRRQLDGSMQERNEVIVLPPELIIRESSKARSQVVKQV